MARAVARAILARSAARNRHRATRGAAVADAVADAAAADPATTGGNVAGNECRFCGKKGHWARECRKKRDEQAHVVQTEGSEGEQALLVATTMIVSMTPAEAASSTLGSLGIHLNESRLYV